MKTKLILGSRGSQLALWQTHYIDRLLKSAHPQLETEIKVIETTGDRVLETALSKIGDKGLFTRQIEEKLLAGEIDLAVHSLKDLPTRLPENLKLGAVTARETPNDALISNRFAAVADLPPNARVATGSLRRKSQLLAYRPDLQIQEIRGNVPTRIRKYEESAELDALILAFAGVHRLGLDAHIRELIPFEIMLPAVAQGVVGIEIREADEDTGALVGAINNSETEKCILAERAFLRRLEGGCQVPIGANARLAPDGGGGQLTLDGFVGNFDGSRTMRRSVSGEAAEAVSLGTSLAEMMIADGADRLLAETRSEVGKSAETVV